jgi:hypothetical protein
MYTHTAKLRIQASRLNAAETNDAEKSGLSAAEKKSRQALKIRELGVALISEGFVTLNQQATALGLSRSTTWTIIRGTHKTSGISAAIVRRMLSRPNLPTLVRSKIFEYVDERCAGIYGNSRFQRRRFVARLGPFECPAEPSLAAGTEAEDRSDADVTARRAH